MEKQGGWLVMEALLAIVISLVLVSGAVQIFAVSDRSIYKERVAVSLVDLSNNIRSAFSTRSDYTGLTESSAESLGLIPTVLRGGGPDGADLSITPGPAGSFDIVLDFGDEDTATEWCAELLPDGRRAWIATGAGSAAGAGMQSGMTVEDAVAACDAVMTFRGA